MNTNHFYSVVKARLQAGSAHAQRYKSALDGLLTIVKEEGVEGLYKGVGNKLLQSVLTAAVLFSMQKRIYEIVKKVSIPFDSMLDPDLLMKFSYLQTVSTVS